MYFHSDSNKVITVEVFKQVENSAVNAHENKTEKLKITRLKKKQD